jgi:uncharacterized protein YggE
MKTSTVLKSKWTFMLVIVAAFLLLFQLVPSKSLAADVTASSTTKSINIMGDGEVNATPDIAYLFLGVTTDKSTTTEALKANSTAMSNIMVAIKKEGIKDEDIKTSSYSLSPKYEYDKATEKSILVGYTVSNTLNVTVKDISKVGQIIDTAVASGANISNGVSFGISDYGKYYNMALVNALSNAQGKAQAIANSLNIKLTTPAKITENSSGIPNNYPIATTAKLESADSTSIQAGTYKVKANINLVYEY